MPDGDIFTRTLARGWRVPARLTNAMTDSQRVARADTKALVQTLVEAGGCPRLEDIASVVRDVECAILDMMPSASAGAGMAARLIVESSRRLTEIVTAADGHKHTRFARDVARSTIAGLIEGGDGAPYVHASIAEHVCWRIIDHYGFDAQRPLLMGERFTTHEQAQAWQAEVSGIMAPRVTAIAQSLEQDPTGQTVRAPRWAQKVPSTADVLSSVVALGPGRKES